MAESSSPRTIPFPREGFVGIQALIELGPERLAKLAEAIDGLPMSLALSQLASRMSELLGCENRTLQLAFAHALVPLNGLRRNLKLRPSDFLAALIHTVSEMAPPDWKTKNKDKWEQVTGKLAPFLEPDNFFSQASKAFDLLSERPAVLQGMRILTELRPIFDEDTTRTLAYLLTNTLVVDYWDGQSSSSLHVTLNNIELDALEAELGKAKKKIAVSHKEAAEQRTNLVTFGDSED